MTLSRDHQKPPEPQKIIVWPISNGKNHVYINIAILSKNIFIDRILTCSVQYIRYESNNVYSFVLLRYWLNTEINLFL